MGIHKSAMEMKICLALVICATAAMATGHAFEAPQDLQSVENEVRKVAAEISTMHHASDDAALDAQATGDDHDAQLDDAKEAHRQADPVMQLEEADDASDSHIQELEGETAKVQSDDTRNDMAQEASAEGFEKAPAADTARAFELADGLKKISWQRLWCNEESTGSNAARSSGQNEGGSILPREGSQSHRRTAKDARCQDEKTAVAYIRTSSPSCKASTCKEDHTKTPGFRRGS